MIKGTANQITTDSPITDQKGIGLNIEGIELIEKNGTARVAVRTRSGNLVHYIVATEKKMNSVISRHATVSG